jgi:hypothetical protein
VSEVQSVVSEVADDRGIFRFQDGEKQRAWDPLDLWERMWTDTEVDSVEMVLQRVARQEIDGVKQAAGLASRMFEIPLFSDDAERGWTQLRLFQLWDSFLAFVIEIKKKLGAMPMPSLRLGSASSATLASSATKPESDLSSTRIESIDAEPTGSEKPSEAPVVAT